MTREDRKKLTALRKALPVLTRSLIKPYRYKSIDGIIWTAQNDMLFTLDPSIAHPLGEEQFYFKVRCGAKPLFADQLLWDILDLEEAKAAPMSLRVNGAFALFEVPAYEELRPLERLEPETVSPLAEEALVRFSQFLNGLRGKEMEWFRELEAKQERYAHMDVMRPLLMIHDGKRDEALAYVASRNISDFIAHRKPVGTLIGEYCL